MTDDEIHNNIQVNSFFNFTEKKYYKNQIFQTKAEFDQLKK